MRRATIAKASVLDIVIPILDLAKYILDIITLFYNYLREFIFWSCTNNISFFATVPELQFWKKFRRYPMWVLRPGEYNYLSEKSCYNIIHIYMIKDTSFFMFYIIFKVYIQLPSYDRTNFSLLALALWVRPTCTIIPLCPLYTFWFDSLYVLAYSILLICYLALSLTFR